jgi:DNA-binding PadR family transcriptional regulator
MIWSKDELVVNNPYRQYGQAFRLWQVAMELGNFTVAELANLTEINANTIYGLLSKLDEQFIQSKDLTSEDQGRGRPRKRYWLTEAGLEELGARNAEILAAMRGMRAHSAPTIDELLGQIMKLSPMEQIEVVERIHAAQKATAAAQVVPRYEQASWSR